MPGDALNIFQTAVTKTATFNGAALNFGGTKRWTNLVARVIISEYKSTATAGAVWTPIVEFSADGTAFNKGAVRGDAITCTTAGQTLVAHIPFTSEQPYARLTMELTTPAGVPSISYSSDIVVSKV